MAFLSVLTAVMFLLTAEHASVRASSLGFLLLGQVHVSALSCPFSWHCVVGQSLLPLLTGVTCFLLGCSAQVAENYRWSLVLQFLTVPYTFW